MAPGLLPGRVRRDAAAEWFGQAWPTVPGKDGLDATGILQAAADGKIDTLVLLGADPLSDFVDRDLAERALTGARTVIAVDQFLTECPSGPTWCWPPPGSPGVGHTNPRAASRS